MDEPKQRNYVSLLTRAITLLLALLLVFYFISVLINSSEFFGESAEKNARLYFEEDIQKAEELVDAHYDNLYEIVEKLKYATVREDVETLVESYIGSEQFGDLRYYSQGVAYAANGSVVAEESSGKEYIDKLSAANIEGCSPVYYDSITQLDCIAFFVPVRGSEVIDGLLSIVPARNIVNVGDAINEKASAIAIIDFEGKVFADRCKEGFDQSIGNNFYTFITSFTSDKREAEAVADAVNTAEECAVTINAGSARVWVVLLLNPH